MNTDNSTKPDNLQQAWQAQSSQTKVTIDADVLLKVVQRDQQSFRSVVRLSDLAGVGISLVLLPAWLFLGETVSSPWTWYLTVPVLVWWVVFPLAYRKRHQKKPGPPDEPLLNCVERSLTEVDEQIWYQGKSFWWSTSPLFVSILVFNFHSAWLRSDDWLDFLSNMDSVVFFLAFFCFLYFMNDKWGCAKYEPRRQELQTLLKSLRDESTSEDTHELSTEQSASSPVSTCRWLAFSGGLFVSAILIAAIGDYLKMPERAARDRQKQSAVRYPKRSPFAAVRWQDSQPEVKLGDEWFKLISLNDIPASEIVAFSKRIFQDQWQQRFEEDLVELLTRMGHPPADNATLVVQSLKASETSVREDVPMTEENRSAIYDANSKRSKR